MDFPIVDLMDQEGCRQKLFDLLHPDGLACPRCGVRDGLNIHRRRPDTPVIDHRCNGCRRVFNMYTNTPWQGTHLSPAQILLILRGVAKGESTATLAREVGISRQHLLRLRHAIQARALNDADHTPLPDDDTEADEMYQNAGEKGIPHTEPDDPPRRRGNQAKGHGTWETDRPPVPGVTGRKSGRLWLRVGHRSGSAELVDATVLPATKPGAMVYTDDWNGYKPLGRRDRGHATVNHNRGEFARDDDGDGVREVHCNTMEGIWTGLRNFLRPFRGVNKAYLEQYVIMFEWSYNLKAVTDKFLRILLGAKVTTELVT
jgi:transposase-like protein